MDVTRANDRLYVITIRNYHGAALVEATYLDARFKRLNAAAVVNVMTSNTEDVLAAIAEAIEAVRPPDVIPGTLAIPSDAPGYGQPQVAPG